MSNQSKNNKLNYLIDPTFYKVIDCLRYHSKIKMIEYSIKSIIHQPFRLKKEYSVLIDGKSFSDISRRSKEGAYKKIVEMGQDNDYTTSNLLDNEYFSKHYSLIAIDLRKQTELENPDLMQGTYFVSRLDKDSGAIMFFIIEKSEEKSFDFSQNIESI